MGTLLLEEYLSATAAHSSRVAVIGPDRQLTFAELDRESNLLAAELERQSIGREDVVGIRLRRSTTVLVAVVGILKAGAAFVILDPADDSYRSERIAQDANLRVVVTNLAMPFERGTPRIDPGSLRGSSSHPRQVAGALTKVYAASDLAYVCYTSGSTGEPRGVEIERGSLANLLSGLIDRLGISHTDRWLGRAPFTFDMAISDLLVPLAARGVCIIASEDECAFPRRFVGLARRTRASIVQTTPSLWRLLLDSGIHNGVKVLVGGEALDTNTAARLMSIATEAWNLYGPTEATVWSTAALIRSHETPHLGTPLKGVRIHVLRDSGEPAAPGERGNIAIEGAGVARGYRRLPGLTARRFVRLGGGERIYHTGDIGGFLDTGELQFYGRSDDQFKFHGIRLEPAEIEAALRSLDNRISQAAVVVGSSGGLPILVGFVVADGRLDPGLLTKRLERLLPKHMIPSRLRQIETLPLSSRGKVDRSTLRRLASSA